MARISQRGEITEEQTGRISLTLRPWALAATRKEVRGEIGPCITAAHSQIWFEIIYEINEFPLFYTRHILQRPTISLIEAADRLYRGEIKSFTWFSDCPYGSLTVGRVDDTEEDEPSFTVHLSINLSWFLESGERARVEFVVDNISPDDMHTFALELAGEIASIYRGECPDPSIVPDEFITLPIESALTKRAYEELGEVYHADYLADPFYQAVFTSWLDKLPVDGVVLDIGCGHGEPVTKELANRGFHVTGIDVSSQMLEKASRKVEGAIFRKQSVSHLADKELFDGACAFFSLLHLDPIELRVALWRICRALKSGGHLLIVSGAPDVNSRRSPFTTLIRQPIWEWHYDLQDIELALTQRGMFEIIEQTEYMEVDKDNLDTNDKLAEAKREQPDVDPGELFKLPPWMDSPVFPMAFAILARKTT